jgi:RNA polymerase sigma-70 factor (ECF subfamily)|tara:strand:- start:252 stop:869 length:618 start_codon:yes stop_codon:yes gene_type:complete
MPDDGSLNSLIEQAVGGDSDALTAVLFMNRDRLERLMSFQIPGPLRRRLDADDLVQEACYRASRHIQSFNPDDHKLFFAWLATIAQNVLKDAMRRHLGPKGSGGNLQFAQGGDSSAMLLSELVVDRQDSPSSQVAAEEGINHVRDAIEMLPEKYREVLSLIYVKNMSAVAVAEQLNLKESAVYMRVARGKEMLRDQLGSQSNFFS